MAYFINELCVNCGTCESDCPAKAITEVDGKCVINKDLCKDCGLCASLCPTKAPNKL